MLVDSERVILEGAKVLVEAVRVFVEAVRVLLESLRLLVKAESAFKDREIDNRGRESACRVSDSTHRGCNNAC